MADEIDVGRFIRLKAAVEGSLKVQPSVMSSAALSGAVERYRSAAQEIVPDNLRSEFDSLFVQRPSTMTSRGPMVGSGALRAAAVAEESRELLLALAAWLQEVVDSHRPQDR